MMRKLEIEVFILKATAAFRRVSKHYSIPMKSGSKHGIDVYDEAVSRPNLKIFFRHMEK